MSIYEFSVQKINGEETSLANYKGKVLLIVNTASKCGFAPQLDGLQALYDKYKDQGLEVLGFPSNQFMNQEPGSNDEINEICKVNYGVTFPMFSKIDVNGSNAHPLYNYLTSQASGILSKKIKWNFTKFLVDQEGNVINRYAPQKEPKDIEDDIKQALGK
ncbi:glutathione peroxidase [Radiobacillus sp. PE A8.2]|uniref:glutathione peroxidase n=1 Tax=Radiobacillus sp. PE A8.2 TaxID=3380349 RepID=UPI00388DAA49